MPGWPLANGHGEAAPMESPDDRQETLFITALSDSKFGSLQEHYDRPLHSRDLDRESGTGANPNARGI